VLDENVHEPLVIPYRFRTQIGDKKRYTWFDVTLAPEHFGKVYTIDTEKLLARRTLTNLSHNNALEHYLALKILQPKRKTELDGYYLRS
jgi:hypothetical protein